MDLRGGVGDSAGMGEKCFFTSVVAIAERSDCGTFPIFFFFSFFPVLLSFCKSVTTARVEGFWKGLSFMFNLGFSRAYVVSKNGLPFKQNNVFFIAADMVYCDLREIIFYLVHH